MESVPKCSIFLMNKVKHLKNRLNWQTLGSLCDFLAGYPPVALNSTFTGSLIRTLLAS